MHLELVEPLRGNSRCFYFGNGDFEHHVYFCIEFTKCFIRPYFYRKVLLTIGVVTRSITFKPLCILLYFVTYCCFILHLVEHVQLLMSTDLLSKRHDSMNTSNVFRSASKLAKKPVTKTMGCCHHFS